MPLKDAESIKIRNASGFIDSANPLNVKIGDGNNTANVNAEGQLHVVLMGKVDDGNSTSTTLNAGEVFTGTAFNTLDYGFIFVTPFSDVASATDGLDVQMSSNGSTNWRSAEKYTIPAGKEKTYAFQPNKNFFRVVYTNGGTNQSVFDLQTIFKKTSSLPTSHRIADNVSGQDDAQLIKSVITYQSTGTDTFKNIGVQVPLPTDGDSLYEKDINIEKSDNGGFSGEVISYFNSLNSVNNDASATNPKIIKVWLKRTAYGSSLGLGCDDLSKNFSNIKLELFGSGEVIRNTIDLSSDNTKRNSFLFEFAPTAFNGFFLSFHTADEVGLSNITMPKETQVVSRIKALKPNGDVTDIDATAGGNLKFSLEEFDKTFNDKPLPVKETSTTAFGDLRTAELHPQFQGSFEYTVNNTDLMTKTETNGGTVTQDSGMAVVSTSTTINSIAMLQSKQHARYKSGLGGLNRFTALFTSPIATTEQYVGLSDEPGSSAAFKNGYMVGYDGTTFGFHRFQNDSKITVSQANWDDPMDGTGSSGMTLDQTKLNVFAIQYQYLGAGAIKLFIESDTTGDFILVHTINYTNNNTEPSTHNPNFFFNLHVDNKATTNDIIVKSSSYAYFIEGKTQFIELHQPQFATGIQEKTLVTSEVAILTIRNRASYSSKTNFIDINIQGIATSIEANAANNLANIRVIKNTTLGGTPSYSDINTTNSVIEIDTSGTTLTGGLELISIPLAGKNDKETRDIVNLRMILNPGETITISGSSSNSATIRAGILWRELF